MVKCQLKVPIQILAPFSFGPVDATRDGQPSLVCLYSAIDPQPLWCEGPGPEREPRILCRANPIFVRRRTNDHSQFTTLMKEPR